MKRKPTQSDLLKARERICDIHAEYLEVHGVKLPRDGTYKAVQLCVLLHYHPEYVHKDDISDIVRQVFPDAGADQQVRHLKRDGWRLESNGGLHRLDPYHPSDSWQVEQARRQKVLGADTFEEIKIAYGNKCATCGAREGRPDTRYADAVITLQQGHRDPEKSSENRLNIIPQCQFCNRAYRGDFTFDEKGRVRAIADVGPVKRASSNVQSKVRDYLNRGS